MSKYRLAWAITCHKMQGQTIKRGSKVVVNWSKRMPQSLAYVMLSRPESVEDLFISGNFDDCQYDGWENEVITELSEVSWYVEKLNKNKTKRPQPSFSVQPACSAWLTMRLDSWLVAKLHNCTNLVLLPHCIAFYRTHVHMGSDHWVAMYVTTYKMFLT